MFALRALISVVKNATSVTCMFFIFLQKLLNIFVTTTTTTTFYIYLQINDDDDDEDITA